MGRKFTNRTNNKPEPLYRTYIGLDEYLIIVAVEDRLITSAYEGSDGSRYMYRRTFLHEDDRGYFIKRDKCRFDIPWHVINDNSK